MIRVNLLPIREITEKFGRRQEIIIAGLSLVLTIVLIIGVYLFQSTRLSSLEKDLADLRKEVAALNAQVKGMGGIEKKISDLKSKLKVIGDLNKKKTGPVRVMESLSSATPSRLWLTQFKETGGSLSLNGLAIDNQTIADFLEALSNSVYFKNVDLVETTQSKQGQVPLKKFSIRSKLLYQPPPTPSPKKAGATKKEGKQG
ncbi:MAG: PilN domain-containing protein [Candidatus Binatia bacterium]